MYAWSTRRPRERHHVDVAGELAWVFIENAEPVKFACQHSDGIIVLTVAFVNKMREAALAEIRSPNSGRHCFPR